MMTIIYRLMLIMVTGLIVKNIYEEDKFINQVMGAMVIIPLVLRAVMVK